MNVLIGLSFEGIEKLTEFILEFVDENPDQNYINGAINSFIEQNKYPIDENGQFWPPVIKFQGRDGFQKVYILPKNHLIFNTFKEV